MQLYLHLFFFCKLECFEGYKKEEKKERKGNLKGYLSLRQVKGGGDHQVWTRWGDQGLHNSLSWELAEVPPEGQGPLSCCQPPPSLGPPHTLLPTVQGSSPLQARGGEPRGLWFQAPRASSNRGR